MVGVIDGVTRYELNCIHHPEHAHFICEKCHSVTCLAPLTVQDALDLARKAGGNEVMKVKVEYTGICRCCAAKEKSK
jgi:Fe2+ or Zn2+ uptake regulation protein